MGVFNILHFSGAWELAATTTFYWRVVLTYRSSLWSLSQACA